MEHNLPFPPLEQFTTHQTMLGPLEILIVCVLGVIAFRVLFLRRNNRVSLMVPFMAALLILSVLLMGYSVVQDRPESRSVTTGKMKLDPVPMSVHGFAAEAVPITSLPPGALTGPPTVHIEETEHGNMLVMPLSTVILQNALGPEGAQALENVTNALPTELNQAYFMVGIEYGRSQRFRQLHHRPAAGC